MAEFPERVGIDEVPLRDLGFSMEGPHAKTLDGGDLTVRAGLGFLELLAGAEAGDPEAQADFLDRFPPAIGIDPDSVIPSEVFEAGRVFAEAVYNLIYGLASDFWTHLTTSPRGRVKMTLKRARTTMTMGAPPPALTT